MFISCLADSFLRGHVEKTRWSEGREAKSGNVAEPRSQDVKVERLTIGLSLLIQPLTATGEQRAGLASRSRCM